MIYTLTLNPTFDIHSYISELKLNLENRVTFLSKDAAGKGVNISRALDSINILNKAVVVVGNKNADEFIEKLNLVSPSLIRVNGRIRENLTIHTDKKETRICFSGFSLSDSILDDIYSNLNLKENDIVTFTGSVPDGISKEKLLKFLKTIKSTGARLVIDSKSITLAELYEIKPWLIKPNQEEISAYFGKDIASPSEAAAISQEIQQKGINNVIISFGEKGALLKDENDIFIIEPPKTSVKSTIGAGDSMIAGFIYGDSLNLSKRDCLKYAVSFGTAACLTDGTSPPSFKTILEIYDKIL